MRLFNPASPARSSWFRRRTFNQRLRGPIYSVCPALDYCTSLPDTISNSFLVAPSFSTPLHEDSYPLIYQPFSPSQDGYGQTPVEMLFDEAETNGCQKGAHTESG